MNLTKHIRNYYHIVVKDKHKSKKKTINSYNVINQKKFKDKDILILIQKATILSEHFSLKNN
jgi:ribosomal protein S15P/S13E